MNARRMLAALLAAAASAGVVAGAAAPAAAQTPTKVIYNGMQIMYTPDSPEAFCTIGVTGSDKYGHDVFISAGHCYADNPYDQQNITDNLSPVYDRNDPNWDTSDPEADPIGYLRWHKDRDQTMTGDPYRDYAVYEMAEGVVGSAHGPHLTITDVMEVTNGSIVSPNASGPATPQEKILGSGIFTNFELMVSGQTGVWVGRITNNSQGSLGTYQSYAAHEAGDSGGPAVYKAGTQFVGHPASPMPSEENCYMSSGPWAGITRAKIVGVPPYIYTSSANIIADLNTRDENSNFDGSVFGAGFETTPVAGSVPFRTCP